MKHHNHNRAFTLVEVLVVLSLFVGVVAAFSYHYIGEVYTQSKIESGVTTLHNNLTALEDCLIEEIVKNGGTDGMSVVYETSQVDRGCLKSFEIPKSSFDGGNITFFGMAREHVFDHWGPAGNDLYISIGEISDAFCSAWNDHLGQGTSIPLGWVGYVPPGCMSLGTADRNKIFWYVMEDGAN